MQIPFDTVEKCKQYIVSDGLGLQNDVMAMYPNATVSGYYFSHPESKYFSIGKIQNDQVEDYSERKKQTINETNKWLSSNI